MRSRVMPGSSVTIERRVPVSRLNNRGFADVGAAGDHYRWKSWMAMGDIQCSRWGAVAIAGGVRRCLVYVSGRAKALGASTQFKSGTNDLEVGRRCRVSISVSALFAMCNGPADCGNKSCCALCCVRVVI